MFIGQLLAVARDKGVESAGGAAIVPYAIIPCNKSPFCSEFRIHFSVVS